MHRGPFAKSCEFCKDPEKDTHGKECCWSRALKIFRFKRRVWHKYILGSIFDMIISVTSVTTDIIAIVNYLVKKKYAFAALTLIPVLLPTFVFTNVYLRDETEKKRKKPVSKVASEGGNIATIFQEKAGETSIDNKNDFSQRDFSNIEESVDTTSTDSSIEDLDKGNECQRNFLFHWTCCSRPIFLMRSCCRGYVQCLCSRDLQLRRKGATIVKNSIQKMFKYGFGTFVLRFIAWAWYIKALIFGVKAFREPKKFLKLEIPENHWSYELLVRLDFLQAALENAPQCCVQLYALLTQPDEDVVLGLLTLCFSFIDFIRISVSVHWDMNKGPVTAPVGCYDTWIWKLVNTSSWIFIYLARASAIALIIGTTGFNTTQSILPISVLTVHVLIFAKVLSKAEYGVAAQKIIVATFISIFFLPELDSSIMPAIVQFYYAMIIFQNTIFIIPWQGFGQEFCFSASQGLGRRGPSTVTATMPPSYDEWTTESGRISRGPIDYSSGARQITQSTTTEVYDGHIDCLIDPVILTLAVPTLTVIGVVCRLASSQKMISYKQTLPSNVEERDMTQNKLETSVSKLFHKKWTQMSVNEMLSAFTRMLKKEVVITEKSVDKLDPEISYIGNGKNKKLSFLSSRLQADFLASQTFIRESFSLMARTTRSHDISIWRLADGKSSEDGDGGETSPPDYNSDSELTLRLNRNLKKRPRLPKSRNVSESTDAYVPGSRNKSSEESTFVQVEMPSGSQYLEMCWV